MERRVLQNGALACICASEFEEEKKCLELKLHGFVYVLENEPGDAVDAGPFVLTLTSGHVIVNDYLNVLLRLDDMPRRVVATLCIRVDIDDLTITLVLEEETGLIVGLHLEVGSWIGSGTEREKSQSTQRTDK